MSIKYYLFTTTSAFILLFVFILFISGILIYYIQTKIKEQNHKLESMFSLVSTIAEQLNSVNQIAGDSKLQKETKICVSDDEISDDEISDDDETTDSEDMDDESIDSDEKSVETTDSDDIDEVYNKVDSIPEYKECFDISVDNNGICDEIDLNDESDSDTDNSEVVEPNNNWMNESNIDNTSENIKHVIIDDVQLDTFDKPSYDITHKTINISTLEEDTNTIDYKKMNITKLKGIVQEKGLINDSSKLKKIDLLKLLNTQ